jgi:chromosome segregation ATPase
MSSYAVNHAPKDHPDNHSHHRGSPDSEHSHHSRLHPDTHENRSESEEYESASQHSSWSYRSHKNTIDEIKRMLDITDEDHERVLNEIKRLQDADKNAQEMINYLNSENDSLMHENHNLSIEVEKLQNMLQNLDTHVRTFMDKYESTNASQRGLSRRRPVRETQSLNPRSRDEDYANEVPQESDRKEIVVHDRQRKPDYHVHTITHQGPHLIDNQQEYHSEDEGSTYNF